MQFYLIYYYEEKENLKLKNRTNVIQLSIRVYIKNILR